MVARAAPKGPQAHIADEEEIEDDIDYASHRHETHRALGVAQAPEDGGYDIVGHDERYAHEADREIAYRAGHGLGRRAHPPHYGMAKAKQRAGQQCITKLLHFYLKTNATRLGVKAKYKRAPNS